MRKQKTLLVLDGVEPFQSGFDFDRGKINDPALSVLVTQLARQNNGLCVITTREKVAELRQFETAVIQIDLEQISKQAGRALLRVGGAQGTDGELEAASEAFGNHALAVSLLATFLHRIEGHHVSNADKIPDLPDVSEEAGKHPRRLIEAFHTRFGDSPQTQLLCVMGLFDRPPDLALVEAVKASPPIDRLTDKLVNLTKGQWHDILDGLRACRLLAPESSHNPDVLDCHPLISEHYADKLRGEQPEAWQAAHRRLYEHLAESTEHQPDTLAGLQPLYQAIAHGCLAGVHQKACDKVYIDRVLRALTGSCAFFSGRKLGAFSSNLAAVACFFDRPWTVVSPELSEAVQPWLLNEAAFCLRTTGRLVEALEPMRAGMEGYRRQQFWEGAAIGAANLCELELSLGRVGDAITDGAKIREYADQGREWGIHQLYRTSYADALYEAGRQADAAEVLRQTEAAQAEHDPNLPLLWSTPGFRYCNLLLCPAEHAAWYAILDSGPKTCSQKSLEACDAVHRRAKQTLEWEAGIPSVPLLDLAMLHISLGRAALYRAIVAESEIFNAKSEIEEAVDTLRRSAVMDYLPRGLLSRALLRFVEGDTDGCRADLDEAWQIAERGPMKLHMADVHLHRARLFRDKQALAQARKLIDACGYHRRDPELADAEQAAQNW